MCGGGHTELRVFVFIFIHGLPERQSPVEVTHERLACDSARCVSVTMTEREVEGEGGSENVLDTTWVQAGLVDALCLDHLAEVLLSARGELLMTRTLDVGIVVGSGWTLHFERGFGIGRKGGVLTVLVVGRFEPVCVI